MATPTERSWLGWEAKGGAMISDAEVLELMAETFADVDEPEPEPPAAGGLFAMPEGT
jgi:hypothetical protein